LFMLSGKSVLWAISVQIHFYVFFMLLWWLHSRRAGLSYILDIGENHFNNTGSDHLLIT
jgi:peptidoglycan/LPS O-acetylase OafA/YrhL